VAREFMRATKANDLRAYADLIAPNADITVAGAPAFTKTKWIESVRDDFAPARQVRFLSVIGNFAYDANKRGADVVFTVEEQHCRPPLIECFAVYRTETIKVLSGKIVSLHRSAEFSHGLAADGLWNSFMDQGH
jgi:hypothetical protein